MGILDLLNGAIEAVKSVVSGDDDSNGSSSDDTAVTDASATAAAIVESADTTAKTVATVAGFPPSGWAATGFSSGASAVSVAEVGDIQGNIESVTSLVQETLSATQSSSPSTSYGSALSSESIESATDRYVSEAFSALYKRGINPLRSEILAATEIVPIATGDEINTSASSVNINFGDVSSLEVNQVARLIELQRIVRKSIFTTASLLLVEASGITSQMQRDIINHMHETLISKFDTIYTKGDSITSLTEKLIQESMVFESFVGVVPEGGDSTGTDPHGEITSANATEAEIAEAQSAEPLGTTSAPAKTSEPMADKW